MSHDPELPAVWRICIVVWSVLTACLGLSGNIFLLYSTIRYKAIKFGRVAVIFINNIAFADACLNILVAVVPTWSPLANQATVSHFFGDTSLGRFLCSAYSHVSCCCVASAAVSICALNVCKLLCLLNPLRGVGEEARWGYLVAGFSWIIYLPVLLLVGNAGAYEPSEFR